MDEFLFVLRVNSFFLASLFRDLQKALAETEQDAMYLGKEEDRNMAKAIEESRRDATLRDEAERATLRQVMEASRQEAVRVFMTPRDGSISKRDLEDAGPSTK